MLRVFFIALFVVTALIIAFLLGPREPIDTALKPINVPDDIDAYLAQSEAGFDDIRPGLQKQIIWADPTTKAQTDWAVVYIHGFSASSGEIRPVPDLVAKALGANLFYTRLSGHGRSQDAMAEPSVNDWLNDTAEALEIGKRLGKHVLVIGTSHGGALTTWATTDPVLKNKIDAVALVSPNYGLKSSAAPLLYFPWAEYYGPLLIGKYREFTPQNEAHKTLWTYRYPTVSLLPMAATTKLTVDQDYKRVFKPALFIYDPDDTVVSGQLIEVIHDEWAGPKEKMIVTNSGDVDRHVIAGDALSPSTTQPIAEKIITWAQGL